MSALLALKEEEWGTKKQNIWLCCSPLQLEGDSAVEMCDYVIPTCSWRVRVNL